MVRDPDISPWRRQSLPQATERARFVHTLMDPMHKALLADERDDLRCIQNVSHWTANACEPNLKPAALEVGDPIPKKTGARGELTVSFEEFNGGYRNIWLSGEASMVFAGEFAC